MNISKRTIKAIACNLLLPGSGYLYLKTRTRYPLAIFLVFGTMYELLRTVGAFIHGNLHHIYQINISPFFPALNISLLGLMLAAVLSVDTYYLAQKSQDKRSNSGK